VAQDHDLEILVGLALTAKDKEFEETLEQYIRKERTMGRGLSQAARPTYKGRSALDRVSVPHAVLSAYEEVRRAFDAMLLAMRRDERGGPDPEQRAQDVQAEHGKLMKALEELQQRAREQLASLERPM
jgi:hypothetical protein